MVLQVLGLKPRYGIDPLAMCPELHDMYPKVYPDGQYMGGGFLPCDDVGETCWRQSKALKRVQREAKRKTCGAT